MPPIGLITVICIVGCLVFGFLYRRAPNHVWYLDQEGDGVSARSVCGYMTLICLVVLVAKLVVWLRG
jgi:hypothetical protein